MLENTMACMREENKESMKLYGRCNEAVSAIYPAVALIYLLVYSAVEKESDLNG
jgi:hypothetical protein